jgi:hypothetical protein
VDPGLIPLPERSSSELRGVGVLAVLTILP